MHQEVQTRGECEASSYRRANNPEKRETVELSSLPMYVRNRGITCVYLHGASSAGDTDGVQTVIHWRLFFATSYGFSLEANSHYAGNMDRHTKLFFRWRNYSYPTHRPAIIQEVFGPFDLKEGVTIQDIINLLLEHRRDRYLLDKNYRGCLTWCETVIHDLEKEGWVAPNLSRHLGSQLFQCQRKYGPVAMPHGVGTFY